MPERIEADVCVVGAGYAGLTAALRLHLGPLTPSLYEGALDVVLCDEILDCPDDPGD